MSLREHWRYSSRLKLIPKKGFESEGDAWARIDELKDKNAKPYLCSICGKWHIGH